ncbi:MULTISPECIES: helix-turn-helix domain-containing protein [Streptomyces]|uniref:HTH cro/C1-type domain-containing protein n=2 Tax=Streptomyces globisporus TaxID=1908 RepID=A0ABN8V243_STRGL|nr:MULTISPECIES: helix-turn-helix transcriptional regulator [Streptomyces]PPA38948.1 transcriptional regulator [Streptomyces griseus]RAN16353.1 transcriptional regulator [Streptomyces badius]AWL85156.1 XRE family transcriptional regulator [Streptomyces globisporus]RAN24209.1 transcriptional regulator [Streptomyces badius]RDL07571.1 DNA-binding XRE family transcriptional regulator [Streptomyces sp. HB202]
MTTVLPDTEVGPLLRDWREQRRISQLELALRADSSARHISFIETGRSRPSEDMVLRLAEHLDIPVRERNALLVIAGYAPRYPQTSLDDPAMASLRESLERLLAAYEPYPALVVDGTYGVVAANRGVALLLEGVPEKLLAPPLNAMRLTLHPEGLAPRIVNLPEWRADLLAQMDRQIALVRSPALRELYDEVAAYPAPARAGGTDRTAEGTGGAVPVAGRADRAGRERDRAAAFALPMLLEHGGRVLSFVSSIATFNTPMDVTVAELAIETFLPADRETAAYLHAHVPS